MDRYEITDLENLFSEMELRKAATIARGGPVPDFWTRHELATYLVVTVGWTAPRVREALVVK